MSVTVIDASVAHAWVLQSQKTAAAFALRTLANTAFVAPFIFSFEIRSGLAKAERQQRLSASATDTALQILHAVVHIEAPPDELILTETLSLSRRRHLSFYDACYLEAALRLGAKLATRDAPLLAAALQEGVSVYDAR
ncbi:MAG: type II toxin-antitoxin system VapC family toxin [Hyphomonadaceae bacterium]|nr:type II toxin-antitoxin system VapC family toxin [Hyphomonadaceae bacterium]GIK50445.1 MAG: hypothetical protein BroJett013_31420 [Alphaproteobacteria bacterium]